MLLFSSHKLVLETISNYSLKQPQHQNIILAIPGTDAKHIHKNLSRVARELKSTVELKFALDTDFLQDNYRFVYLFRDLKESAQKIYFATHIEPFTEYQDIKDKTANIDEFIDMVLPMLEDFDQNVRKLDFANGLEARYQEYINDENTFMINLCRHLFN